MLQLYPNQASTVLEFEKIRQLLLKKCTGDHAKERVLNMRFMSKITVIEKALKQTQEYQTILTSGNHLPNDFSQNITKELQLIVLKNAALTGEQLNKLKALTQTIFNILNWLKSHETIYPYLFSLTEKIIYEKQIDAIITPIIDEQGNVKDTASNELLKIRTELQSQRNLARRQFETVLRRLNKLGYLADTSEAFLNGRRTVAVFAENKRMVKGILHGESDTQKTVFIEPEETIPINNDIVSLEKSEEREILNILRATTQLLAPFQPQLLQYEQLCGIYDFIRAKAFFSLEIQGSMPALSNHARVNLVAAYHPLLLLQNKTNHKATFPLSISLNNNDRVLIISGPNAGGKTVAMKTVGLLQMMLQSGMLVPVSPDSEMGIFKQLFVHLGDTQSIENELSTYSAHLRDMKYFIEFANGKTLFLIDELGSGSDPVLGGAFAEAIVENLAQKNALGIITTHYLNLKIMAGKTAGILNGAMAFDEDKLAPLYQLIMGKPGSSYTFAIAQRAAMPTAIISRAKQLIDKNHVQLDLILHKTEKQSIQLTDKEKTASRLITENENLKRKYELLIDKEKWRQQIETQKLQNQIKKEELDYLKDTERKLKQIITDWKKIPNKEEVMASAEKLLFKKRTITANTQAARKADKAYFIVGGVPQIGDFVRHTETHQIGILKTIKGKKAVIQIGQLPFTVSIDNWIVVKKNEK